MSQLKRNNSQISETFVDHLEQHGVSRRGFLKFCSSMAAALALPTGSADVMAEALSAAKRPTVIWLSFQECTGCTESITRSHTPTIENLIFDFISLDYHHTLQVAAGHQAEEARDMAMKDAYGKYLLIVDGSIPTKDGGVYSTIAGRTNLSMLEEAAAGAAAVISVGTCAAYGGLPMAKPNPTGAVAVTDIVKDKPVMNIPGCPPIGLVMTSAIAHFLTFARLPDMDELGRPKAFYGDSIHDRCYRRTFYDQGLFAKAFDDEGARKGWCLYELGCKGPTTHNACATMKWNEGTSFPIESGHPCLGCSEPNFWDAGSFYEALSVPQGRVGETVLKAAAVGVGVGVAA
ncbi:MAG TPA: hydrogenase small subunit, partial [Gammaproteobacteria bacterium]|nr:hydrogenase small subunit [Gammaproteobacteria bacterium]